MAPVRGSARMGANITIYRENRSFSKLLGLQGTFPLWKPLERLRRNSPGQKQPRKM